MLEMNALSAKQNRKHKNRPRRTPRVSDRARLGSMSSGRLPARFLDETIAVFQPMSARALNREDAREIVLNMTGFFSVLSEWLAEEGS
jgi:hypothetical protein